MRRLFRQWPPQWRPNPMAKRAGGRKPIAELAATSSGETSVRSAKSKAQHRSREPCPIECSALPADCCVVASLAAWPSLQPCSSRRPGAQNNRCQRRPTSSTAAEPGRRQGRRICRSPARCSTDRPAIRNASGSASQVVSLLWSDDIDTAFRHLDLYDRFGCPGGHIQAAFRCLILHASTHRSEGCRQPERAGPCLLDQPGLARSPPPPAAARQPRRPPPRRARRRRISHDLFAISPAAAMLRQLLASCCLEIAIPRS